jgi:hypothetical protein
VPVRTLRQERFWALRVWEVQLQAQTLQRQRVQQLRAQVRVREQQQEQPQQSKDCRILRRIYFFRCLPYCIRNKRDRIWSEAQQARAREWVLREQTQVPEQQPVQVRVLPREQVSQQPEPERAQQQRVQVPAQELVLQLQEQPQAQQLRASEPQQERGLRISCRNGYRP